MAGVSLLLSSFPEPPVASAPTVNAPAPAIELFTGLFFIVFLIIISPLLVYNYNTAGSFTTSNSSFLILMEWDNVPEEWYEDTSYDTSLLLFRDPGLLVENFSRNIFDSTTQVILNLNDNWNNLSIIPLIPFIGMIPFLTICFSLISSFFL